MVDHFYRNIMPLLGADNGFWVVLVRLTTGESAARDLCHGWRVRDVVPAKFTPKRVAAIHRFLDSNDKQNPIYVGQTTVNILAACVRFRSARLHGSLVDWEEFRHTEHQRLYYETCDVMDRLWVVFPVNEDVELCYCFDRQARPTRRAFSPQTPPG